MSNANTARILYKLLNDNADGSHEKRFDRLNLDEAEALETAILIVNNGVDTVIENAIREHRIKRAITEGSEQT